MDNATLIILILGMFLLTAVAVGAALYFLLAYSNPEPSLLEKRLMRVKEQSEAELDAQQKISRQFNLVLNSAYSNKELGELLDNLSPIHKLKKLLIQADMHIHVDRFLMMIIGPAIVCFLLGVVSMALPLLALTVLIPAGAIGYVVFKKNQRNAKLLNQLPDALGLLTSSLRAGHAFQSAMTVVSSEMADPIASEFALLVRDINLGVPLKDSLGKMQNKLEELTDVRIFVTAVLIQREAGGNLAEILEKLSYTIRERFKLKRQISSLTAQSRLTGYVLGAAPFVLFAVLFMFFPAYIQPMLTNTLGKFALVLAGIMMTIGFFVIKKIVDIRT